MIVDLLLDFFTVLRRIIQRFLHQGTFDPEMGSGRLGIVAVLARNPRNFPHGQTCVGEVRFTLFSRPKDYMRLA
jgi:hypothetical protein